MTDTGLPGMGKAYEVFFLACGKSKCKEGSINIRGDRGEHYIHVITDGKGTFQCNGDSIALEKGDVIYTNKGSRVRLYADRVTPWNYYWISFTGSEALSILIEIGLNAQKPLRKVSDLTLLKQDLDNLEKAYKPCFSERLRQNGLFYIFLSDLARDFLHEQGNEIDYAKKAYELIWQNQLKTVSVETLAFQLGVSRSLLTKYIKKHYGMTSKEFIQSIQFEKASRMLATKKWYISEIARQSGFPSAIAFSKEFKAWFHITPSDYRKNMMETERER